MRRRPNQAIPNQILNNQVSSKYCDSVNTQIESKHIDNDFGWLGYAWLYYNDVICVNKYLPSL